MISVANKNGLNFNFFPFHVFSRKYPSLEFPDANRVSPTPDAITRNEYYFSQFQDFFKNLFKETIKYQPKIYCDSQL